MRHPILTQIMEQERHWILPAIIFIMLLCMYAYHPGPQLIPLTRSTSSTLHEPTWDEAYSFMMTDKTNEHPYNINTYNCYNFALDTVLSAETYGIRCYLTIVDEVGAPEVHAIVAFHTTDHGWKYYEPQDDQEINLMTYDYRDWSGVIFNNS